MQLRSAAAIRFAMAALFLWFGAMQLTEPAAWVGFLPEWTGYFPIPAEILIRMNGLFEVLFALLLAVGAFTRVVAFLLGAHLLFIAVSVGGAIGVRDAALAVTTLALAFAAPDALTLDAKRP